MDEYKGNSHREKKEEKTAHKVISGKAKVGGKPRGNIFDLFIAEDAGSIRDYLIMDVIVPAIRDTLVDIIISGVKMTFYGETGNVKKSGSSRTSYSDYYERGEKKTERGGKAFNYITLDSRTDAEDVLVAMDELIDCYGKASVADLYEAVGIDGDYTGVECAPVRKRVAPPASGIRYAA